MNDKELKEKFEEIYNKKIMTKVARLNENDYLRLKHLKFAQPCQLSSLLRYL